MDINTNTNTDIDTDISVSINTDFSTDAGIGINADTNTGVSADTDMDANANAAPVQRPVMYARFPRSFGFEFALHIFLGPPLVVLWSFVAYYCYLRGAVSFPILKVAVYYSAAFGLALLLYGNNRATRRGSGVILDGERIVEKRGGGVGMLDYADIRGFRCTRNPLFNKKMVIAHTVGKVALPLNLSGSYKMVETIIERLTAGGRLNGGEKKAADAGRRLYVTALRYNALYGLRGRHLYGFIAVSVASAIFNGAVAMLYWERGLATALAWGFAGMLFQALGYLAAERFWAWKLFENAEIGDFKGVKSVNDGDGDDLFKAIHATAAVAALLACMVAGIAVTLPAM